MIAQAKALVMALLEHVLATVDLLGLIVQVRKSFLEHDVVKNFLTNYDHSYFDVVAKNIETSLEHLRKVSDFGQLQCCGWKHEPATHISNLNKNCLHIGLFHS